jgi:hypothetical protein
MEKWSTVSPRMVAYPANRVPLTLKALAIAGLDQGRHAAVTQHATGSSTAPAAGSAHLRLVILRNRLANSAACPDVCSRHFIRPQEGKGQEIAIPRGYRLRPVEAVQVWPGAADRDTGAGIAGWRSPRQARAA